MLTITGRLRYDVVRRLLPLDVRTVLEIGCGRGALGCILARQYSYLGIEPDPESFAVAHSLLGPRVRRLREEELEPGAYDLVCAFEVLEHIEATSRPVPLARACPSGWLVAHQRSGTSKPLRRDRRSRRSLPAVRRRRPPGCPRPRRLSRRVPVLVRLSRGLCAPLREQAARSTRRRLRGGSNGCQRTLAATFSDHCVRSPPGRRTVLIGAASVRQQVGRDRPRRPSPSCARIEGARLPSHSSCTAAWRGFGERPDAARVSPDALSR